MTNTLSIIIPVGSYHAHIAEQAIASATAQTVPCDVIVIQDTEGRGAGHARNRGLEQCKTMFAAFLDADDIIAPTFAEVCLGVLSQYAQTHDDQRYVYTDWLGVENVRMIAPEPCIAWTEQTFHLVTAVVPTERARLIGGFDENMTGVEDADFYLRLRLSGLCGIHVESPLVSYREGGQRSIQARASGQEARIQQYMTQRYGGFNLMGCCGDNTPHPTGPDNEPQAGDVLAQALWNGNRIERGRATGRLYPRTSFPKLMYVDERDVNAAPQLWKRVETPMQASNGVVLQPAYAAQAAVPWQDTVNAIYGGNGPVTPAQPVEYQYKPNKAKSTKAETIQKAQEWVKVDGVDG